MNTELTLASLPTRDGVRPKTTDTNPHQQLNQQPEDLSFIQQLHDWAFASFSNIQRRPSQISVPGSVAMWMDANHTCDGCNAFMVGTEFAHFHPNPDYSMHLSLPTNYAQVIITQGWGEWHPLIKRGFLPPNIILMYTPRDAQELEVAKFILKSSYEFAKGNLQ